MYEVYVLSFLKNLWDVRERKIGMQQIINSLIHFDRSKIDIAKGIRQGFLMILPALIGYLLGFPMFGILISTGTLAHVYVFSGSPQSMLKQSSPVHYHLLFA